MEIALYPCFCVFQLVPSINVAAIVCLPSSQCSVLQLVTFRLCPARRFWVEEKFEFDVCYNFPLDFNLDSGTTFF